MLYYEACDLSKSCKNCDHAVFDTIVHKIHFIPKSG